MASNAEISESLTTLEDVGYPRDEESESERRDDEAGSEQQEKESVEAAKHPFSEPWEESDLILAVEEETFHVHRQIMSIHSPVFKAMLKSVGIKEDMATEIQLPGKKADEFLDFLKILYLKEKEGIELNKMGHILKLADDYKVEGVHDFCSKMLRDLPKSEDNAVKVFFLSTQTLMAREDDRLEPVRSQCKTIVKDMDLVDIQGSGVLKKLNKDACESLLVERIKGLETHVTQVYPQFVGLAEYCLHLGLKCSLPGLVKCPEHFINAKVNTALPERIVSCLYCKKMINQLVQLSSLESEGHEHVYGGEHHFNSDLISILKNFTTVMRSLQRKTSLGAAQNLLIAGTSPFEAKTHAASPVRDSKAFTETVKSVGFPPPAAKPGIQALPSPIVGNEAYQSSGFQFANVAPGSPTTDVETSLSGSTIEGLTTLRTVTGLGGTPFGYKGSTGIGTGTFVSTTTSSVTFGTGSSLFGSAGSTETVGKGNFGQLTLATTPASKANSASFPLNRRGKR